MTALMLSHDATAVQLTKRSLLLDRARGDEHRDEEVQGIDAAARYKENWLQELLFQHPELILLDGFEQAAGMVAPLCREFPLPRLGRNVFLDVLGVAKDGRIVLVECKLWRNPQARREVVAQILEYASLLREWSFADLSARLNQKRSTKHANPAYEVACRYWPELDEVAFVDAVSRSLSLGDFYLVIAGDGIRSDLHQVTTYLNGNALTRLLLLEIRIWDAPTGQTIIVPSLPFKTEIAEQRVIVSQQGVPLRLVDDDISVVPRERTVPSERASDPDQAQRRQGNRVFWQRFIDEVRFDHPEQPKPRHGGDNWVKIDLAPGIAMTVYRSTNVAGMLMRLRGEEGYALFEAAQSDLDLLRSESGGALEADIKEQDPFEGELVVRNHELPAADEPQLRWLEYTANRLVNTLRPWLACRLKKDA